MKRRAEVDAEIIKDRRASAEIKRSIGRRSRIDDRYDREVAEEERGYRWAKLKNRKLKETRDGHIRELYAMGMTRQELAVRFDLTAPRIDQIVAKP